MSEVIEAEGAELVEYQEPASTNLFRTDNPAEVLKRATETANALAPVIQQQGLYSSIKGRKHIKVEGWITLGAMLGVTPVCEWTRKLDNGWEARVEAKTLDGRTIGAAEAECLREEKRWADADDYAVRSMAQTRATSKALGSVLRFVATLAGFEGTPDEEMPRDEDRGASWQDEQASGPQKATITRRCNELAISDDEKRKLFAWAGGAPLTKAKASKLIELLKDAKDRGQALAGAGIETKVESDLPVDAPAEDDAEAIADEVFGAES